MIRARGFVSGGYCNGSGGLLESISQNNLIPLLILTGNQSMGFENGEFGFQFSGQAGKTVVVEGSTNLLDWQPLETNVLGAEPTGFSHPAVQPLQFYRIRAD